MNTLAFVVATVSGRGILGALGWVLVIAVIAYLLWWGLAQWALGEPFNKIGRGIIALFVVVGLIHVILKLAGKPGIIDW